MNLEAPFGSWQKLQKMPDLQRIVPQCSQVLPRYYFHVNESTGIVQKIDFDIRPDLGCTTLKTSRKVNLGNPSVCLSVRPSVLLSLSRELSRA